MTHMETPQRKPKLGNTLRPGTWICLALLGTLFLALILRAPYGFDWTDEPYYTVLPYRLALGDRPLIDMWEVHQLSGMLALPFLQLYLLFTGGDMSGAMLYFRYVLVFVQFAISVYGFFVLRRKSGDVAGFLCAGLILMHVHYGLNGFSYNAMAPLFCILSVLLVFDGLEGRQSLWRIALSGACYAFAVQAYPYFVISLPVYILFWWMQFRRGKKMGQPRAARASMAFLLGVLAVGVGCLIFVCLRAGGGDLLAGLRGMLSDPDHTGESVALLLAQYVNAIRVLFSPVFIGAVGLTLIAIIACYWKHPAQRIRLQKIGLALCVALILFAVIWMIPYDYPNHHKINMAAMSLVLIAPALYFLSGRKPHRGALLIFLGCALSIAVQLGSNTRIRSSSGMLLPASIGTLIYLFDTIDQIFTPQQIRMWVKRAAAAACLFQLLLTASLRMVTVYRDATLTQLNTTIAQGPARGIVTTEKNVADYEAVYMDLTRNTPEHGALLVTNLLPVAYLMTPLSPATPSAFNMTMDASWLAQYYETNSQRIPDYIYAVDPSVGQSNDISLSGVAMLPALTGRSYRMERLTAGTLFGKQ